MDCWVAGGDAANGLQRIILGSGISGKPYAAAAAAPPIYHIIWILFSVFQRKMPQNAQTVVRSKRDEIDFILFLYCSQAAKTLTMCF